ncbi:MAG: NAD(P)-binding protein [Actinomycetia bacterium]|nr:NAD(P)-binding protein [Actinomycetes bacterium]
MTGGAAAEELLVVGGGVSGIACARAIADAGCPVVVRDRGHRLGGRMAVKTIDDRPVDVGASYFTVSVPAFQNVVDRWLDVELVRPWTDTFHVGDPGGLLGTRTGPMRYATPLGLRSLIEDLSLGLPLRNPDDVREVEPGPTVDSTAYAGVALAMPGPQALDLLGDSLEAERAASGGMWEPCIALIATYDKRVWPDLDGVFVNDSVVLTFVADDGRRRGDDAPVLVAHAHPVLSAAHLDNPDAAIAPMLGELEGVLGISVAPSSVIAKRWSLAKPVNPHVEHYFLGKSGVGLCGDGWHGPSRIESAYLSGRALGRAMARRGPAAA